MNRCYRGSCGTDHADRLGSEAGERAAEQAEAAGSLPRRGASGGGPGGSGWEVRTQELGWRPKCKASSCIFIAEKVVD